jgi:hypothetical protein
MHVAIPFAPMRELEPLVQLPVAVREPRISFQLPLSPRPDAPCLGGIYQVKSLALPRTHDESPFIHGSVFHHIFGVAKQNKGADIDSIEVLSSASASGMLLHGLKSPMRPIESRPRLVSLPESYSIAETR